jgi:hypothetical protein
VGATTKNIKKLSVNKRSILDMPDKFDPYREALVMETHTIWPEEYAGLDDAVKAKIREILHADPENAGGLEYVRTHTGFCRQITVTADDVERWQG